MKKFLIIETINNRAGASEGKALEEALKLWKDYADQREAGHLEIEPSEEAYTESEFRKLLGKSVDYLHVSAHGESKGNIHRLEIGRQEERGKIIKRGVFVGSDLVREAKVKARRILVSACFSGHQEFAEAFFSDNRLGVYLGPCREVDFVTAFAVALSFHLGLYNKSIKVGRSIDDKGRIFSSGTYYYYRSPQDLR